MSRELSTPLNPQQPARKVPLQPAGSPRRSRLLYLLYLIYLLYLLFFTHSSALFCTLKKHKPLLFNRFRTLRQKSQLPAIRLPGVKDKHEISNC